MRRRVVKEFSRAGKGVRIVALHERVCFLQWDLLSRLKIMLVNHKNIMYDRVGLDRTKLTSVIIPQFLRTLIQHKCCDINCGTNLLAWVKPSPLIIPCKISQIHSNSNIYLVSPSITNSKLRSAGDMVEIDFVQEAFRAEKGTVLRQMFAPAALKSKLKQARALLTLEPMRMLATGRDLVEKMDSRKA